VIFDWLEFGYLFAIDSLLSQVYGFGLRVNGGIRVEDSSQCVV
jgi:hypothetical protein